METKVKNVALPLRVSVSAQEKLIKLADEKKIKFSDFIKMQIDVNSPLGKILKEENTVDVKTQNKANKLIASLKALNLTEQDILNALKK